MQRPASARTPAPSRILTMLKTVSLSTLPLLLLAHSNVIIPKPRNAIDALTDARFGSCAVGKGCAPLNNGKGKCGYGPSRFAVFARFS